MFYRKYRPQNVSEIDNKRIRETLGAALLANNWGQAYLFVGPKGTGKTSMARILAKIVNCESRKKGQEPCNKCDSCKAITAGTSLDVVEIDAASNTGVDDVRDLREKVRLAPTSSPHKIYIIDEVHMLSNSAFNALLKTLEEPPSHVIFVLATTEAQKLPETIVSRCLVYDFGRVSQDEIISSLGRVTRAEKLEIKKEILLAVAAQSGRSFRDAHKILEQLTMQSANIDLEHLDALNMKKIDQVASELLSLLAARDKKASLSLVESYSQDDSEKIKDLINRIILKLRNILLLENGVKGFEENILISSQDVKILVEKLTEALVLMADCPVPQLPLELVIVEYCDLEKPDRSKDQKTQKETPGFWQQVLEAVRPLNHSLVALLRASRPGEIKDGVLTLEVFYKFHKEKLEEPKNREILEKVISGIMNQNLKIKFILKEKAGEK